MRRSLPFLALLLAATASCGQADRSMPPSPSDQAAESSNAAADMSFSAEEGSAPRTAQSRAAGPNVAPTAAPGVAFNYRYAFQLQPQHISAVQERHAQMCEQLTIARCRITGMLYRVVNNGRDIEAMLALKVHPAAARHFGRDAVGVVVGAEGMLTESEITGVDIGTSIQAAGRSLAELQAELERIEARLRAMGAGAQKSQLEYEAGQLRQQIRDLRESRTQQQETLATTPMVFHYGSGAYAPGFGQGPSLKQALQRAGDDLLYSLNILLVVLVRLLPWALAILLGWLGFRFVRRRWVRSPADTTPA
ncbi:MAG TPA: cell division protein ZapB [Allosphingosinicella sp.]|nr:cell division protein ZapB [Allosphingosinicella sp.]